uniref:Pyrin domain-containing protein n=1 Tax=Monopterus albus TaxID=43700 RepID=A0A3Q3JHT4_MONAL
MTTFTEVLLQTLEDLGDDDFKKFKWYLWQKGALDGFPEIGKSRLENADRLDTVDQMVQTYGTNTVKVTRIVLVKINQNNLPNPSESDLHRALHHRGRDWRGQ